MVRRGMRADGSGPLPQFDLDPDKTLERLPRIDASRLPHRLADDVSGPALAADADLASTVEIVPELDADDILEAIPVRRPPIVLPPPVQLPLDLNRLLAHAQAEARRSPAYFHSPVISEAAVPVGPAAAPSRTDPTVAIASAMSLVAGRPRPPLAWVIGTVLAAAFVSTLTVAAVQSRVSSARSPESITVTHEAAPVVASPAPQAAPATKPSNGIPSMSVQNLPRVEAGTISLAAVAANHRLFVDGKLASAGTTTVSCGPHVVQVGSRGARHLVQVPCGQDVVVAN